MVGYIIFDWPKDQVKQLILLCYLSTGYRDDNDLFSAKNKLNEKFEVYKCRIGTVKQTRTIAGDVVLYKKVSFP